MEESIHVVFDESNSCNARKDISNDFIDMMDSLNLDGDEKLKESNDASSSGTKDDDQASMKEITQEEQNDIPKDWRTMKDHPLDNVIGEITKGDSEHNNVFLGLQTPFYHSLQPPTPKFSQIS
ncbi:hypothetical protein PIB30_095181 [Stylosanthes scabra]|uniref:Uncharacterized protein n=1 Tax=Stylosanthes scabra TaxID=79078 RepID=A0ABU6YUG2_9FABA|nr:hypothetical protein [Stylosanthes scabra]